MIEILVRSEVLRSGRSDCLPALRGLAAIGAKNPQKAIDLLQANSAYEFSVPL